MNDELHQRLQAISDFPTLPEVVHKILATVQDPKSSIDDMVAVLETDHTISLRVLRLANSAFYGGLFEVDSIRRAVVVIGFYAVRNLALATSVFDSLRDKPVGGLEPREFWLHCLGTAKAAQVLASRHGHVDSPEGCFTAGLLHDVGKYLLAIALPEDYGKVAVKAVATNQPVGQIEEEFIGSNHSAVGGWLSEQWNFPRPIQAIIRYLHQPLPEDHPHRTDIQLVRLAEWCANQADFGDALELHVETPLEPLLEGLSIEPEQVLKIVTDLTATRSETEQFLGLLQGSG